VAAIPLSDEETVLIFAGEALSNYEGLDAGAQRTVIECLQQVMGAETPPTAQRYERIANLDIIRCGDQPRLYTKMVENIPEENVTYHVIFLFYIDYFHDYPHKAKAEYSRKAKQQAENLRSIAYLEDVEEYLEQNDAMTKADLDELLSS
jgi:hypothetical protein